MHLFKFSDSWVLVALYLSSSDSELEPDSLASLIAYGDMVNKSILLLEEINEAFGKFEYCLLIIIKNGKPELTPFGNSIITQLELEENNKGNHHPYDLVRSLHKQLNIVKIKKEFTYKACYSESMFKKSYSNYTEFVAKL